MEVITKGYLISKKDYQDFDEIITFINEYGIKFTAFSAGSRKISSKNGRNLNIGNYLEFEFFHASLPDKLSRLKKVTTVTYLPEELKLSYSLNILNDYYEKIEFMENLAWFELYQDVIRFILDDTNDYLLMLYICVNIYKLNGYSFSFDKCCFCGTTYHLTSIDLYKQSIACSNCVKDKKYLDTTINIWKQIQENPTISLKLIKDFNLDNIRILVKDLMQFIYDELGLFSDLYKSI